MLYHINWLRAKIENIKKKYEIPLDKNTFSGYYTFKVLKDFTNK